MPVHYRKAITLVLCLIALLSSAQASGIAPRLVSADKSVTVLLLRVPASTDSSSATAMAMVDLDNGEVRIELHQATPISAYTAVFVSGAVNIQIGTFVTNAGGEGLLQTTWNSGVYTGVFEITRLGLLQFASVSVSFTIETPASVSISETSTTESSTVSISSSEQFVLQVDPPTRSINAGDFAKFNIRIAQNTSANIFLVAREVPSGSVAIFTPNVGVANPEFHSTLIIVTSANTPAGTYAVKIAALANGQEYATQISLQVTGPVTTQSTTIATGPPTLTLTVTTDQSHYQPNSSVTVQGHVIDLGGNAVVNVTVSIQVDSPTGAEVFFTSSIPTDATGTFRTQFDLRGYVASGTYTVFASAAKANYSSVASRATFVVGSSTTPSVVINAVYAGDSSGNPLSTFSTGQTVWIWVVVQNIGATFQGVVWIQVRDPNGVPIEIRLQITSLHAGETVKDGIGFTLQGNPTLGVYRVDALVSDNMISQGGTFLASAQTQFVITG